ncbi:MAG: DUF600 family protein [Deltaproteobacteria bacterium]|nr:DUF600 family protein [Deltaproteobacteria bacterium]
MCFAKRSVIRDSLKIINRSEKFDLASDIREDFLLEEDDFDHIVKLVMKFLDTMENSLIHNDRIAFTPWSSVEIRRILAILFPIHFDYDQIENNIHYYFGRDSCNKNLRLVLKNFSYYLKDDWITDSTGSTIERENFYTINADDAELLLRQIILLNRKNQQDKIINFDHHKKRNFELYKQEDELKTILSLFSKNALYFTNINPEFCKSA